MAWLAERIPFLLDLLDDIATAACGRCDRCTGRSPVRCAVGLDLDPDDSLGADLGDEVDLVVPLLLAEVVKTQEIPVPQDGVPGHADDPCEERWIDEVPLGAMRESLEPIGRPRGERLDDLQVGEKRFVGECRSSVDAGGVVQRLVLDQPGRVQRIGLEVAPDPGERTGAWTLARTSFMRR
jgi:hypothetical protein